MNPQFHNMLTEREQEVLDCLVEGMTNREIADRLFIAETTVSWYNRQIYNKLGVDNRRQAAKYARQHNLEKPDTTQSQRKTKSKHNLPASITPFVGRGEEIQRLKILISNNETRLITILAPGGMGKTRLALETARYFLDSFQDGVYFIALQPIAEANQIMEAVGKQIQPMLVTDHHSVVEHVLDMLKNRQLLLVMDNYEHLIEGAHYVTDILEHAPDVKIIVTSRQRLNFHSETVMSLSGLPRVSRKDPSDATTLFLDSVKRLNPDYSPTEADYQKIDEICDLTQGMPLALLLAAAWSNTLTIAQIAEEITKGIDFLESDSGDLPERHQGIRSVFEPTWWRLSYDERLIFARMSVFAGGCTLEAVTQITDVNVLILRDLVNKALITLTESGRYEIHELLRQYAEEKLRLLGDYDEAKQAHAEHYAELMRWYGNNFYKVGAFNKIATEIDNIRAMWWHLVVHEQWRWLEIMMIGFRRMLNAVANYHEIARWYQFAIETLEQSDEFEKEQGVYGSLMGCLVYVYDELKHVNRKQMHDRAYHILDGCELNLYSGYVLLNLAIDMVDDTDLVLRTFDRVVPIFKQANFSNGLTIAHIMRMYSYMNYDLDLALDHGLEAVAIAEQAGDLAGGGWATGIIGEIMMYRYQYNEALKYSYQHYENFRRIKMFTASTSALSQIAQIHFLLGENVHAISTLKKSIEQCRLYKSIRREIITLFDICSLYIELEQIKEAEYYFNLAKECIETYETYKDNNQIKHFVFLLESWLSLVHGNYDEAQATCRLALNSFSNTSRDTWLSRIEPLQHYVYAQVLIAQQQLDEATSFLRSAIKVLPPAMFYKQLQGIMTYAQLRDMPEKVALLSFVANHAGTAPIDRKRANSMLDDFSQTLDESLFEEIVKRGQTFDLTSVIDQLMI